jgi:hypothetical protein
MGRNKKSTDEKLKAKKFTDEELKAKITIQNQINYNRILASQSDQKRFNKSCEIIERFLLGVETLDKSNDEKITVNILKLETILRKAKTINLNIRMENSVEKIMKESLINEI